jgi:RimJ/RimL family protein N-acetyltransferase
LLRPWRPEDLAEFTRLLTDPVVTRYIVVSTPFSSKDVAELHREFWGQGLATEGGQAGVRHGFETVGLERIISTTMAATAASRRVMEKCGLRFQGELPIGGTVVAWYAIDRADWRAGQRQSSV